MHYCLEVFNHFINERMNKNTNMELLLLMSCDPLFIVTEYQLLGGTQLPPPSETNLTTDSK